MKTAMQELIEHIKDQYGLYDPSWQDSFDDFLAKERQQIEDAFNSSLDWEDAETYYEEKYGEELSKRK